MRKSGVRESSWAPRHNRKAWAVLVAAGSAALGAGAPARADQLWWSGSTDNTWGTAANWVTDPSVLTPAAAAPGSNDTAIFNANVVTTALGLLNLNGPQAAGGVVFADNATNSITLGLSSDVLALGSGGFTVTSLSGAHVVNAGLSLNGDQAWTNDSAGVFTVNGTVASNVALTLAGNVTLNGAIAGSGGLTKTGAGTLTLGSGASTFDGAINVLAGTLKTTASATAGAGPLGSTNGGTIVSTGATLDLNGQNLGAEQITVGGAGVGSNGAIVNSGAQQLNALRYVTLTGDTTFGGTGRWDIRSAGGGTTGASLLTGGQAFTLTKVGSGQVSIVDARVDPALGDINLNQGAISIEAGTTLGDPTKSFNMGTGTTLQFWGITAGNTPNKQFVFNTKSGVTTTLKDGSGAVNVIGPINTTGNGTLNVDAGTTSVTITLSGTVGGSAGLTKVNPGLLVLPAANTYTGQTWVQNGTVQVNSLANALSGTANSLGKPTSAAVGVIKLGSGTNTGTLRYVGAGSASTDRGFDLAGTSGGGVIESSGTGAVSFTGNVTASGSGAKTLRLTGSNLGANVFAGNIPNSGGGAVSLLKDGAGFWSVRGNSTFAGQVSVTQGTLEFTSIGSVNDGVPTSLGAPTDSVGGTINLGSGANAVTFRYVGGADVSTDRVLNLAGTTGPVTIDGSGVGALRFYSDLLVSGTGNKTLVLTGTNAALNMMAGAIVNAATGTTSLMKMGSGTWVLNANNTYAGTTNVNAGVLAVDTIADPGTGFYSNLGAGAVLLTGGTLQYTGSIPVSATSRVFSAVTTNSSGLEVVTPGTDVSIATQFAGNVNSSVNKLGAGSLTLTGTTDNSNLVVGVQAGLLNLDKSGTSRAVYGISAIAPGAVVRFTGSGSDQIGPSSGGSSPPYPTAVGSVNVTGGTLDLNGHTELIERLTGAGTVTSGTANPSQLQVGQNNGTSQFDGVIENGSGVMSLTKTSTGILTLTGKNTYTGATVVNGGVLRAADGVGLPSGGSSGNLNLTGGTWETTGVVTRTTGGGAGQVQLNGTAGFSAHGGTVLVNLSGGATLKWGVSNFNPGTFVLNEYSADGDIRLANAVDLNNGTRTFANNSPSTTATVAGSVTTSSGSGGVVKNGGGTIVFAGPVGYSGVTTVNFGTLRLSPGASVSKNGQVSVAAGATLDLGGSSPTIGSLSGNGAVTTSGAAGGADTLTIGNDNSSTTYNGTISDAAGGSRTLGITKVGAGTLTLGGANAYGGQTTIGGGTLRLQGVATAPLAGATVWLDATDITGAGGANLANGASVSTWVNKGAGGSSYNGTQAAVAKQPTVASGVMNGLDGIHFTGTSTQNDLIELSGTNVGALANGPHTIFAVARSSGATADDVSNTSQGVVIIPGFHSGISLTGNSQSTFGAKSEQWNASNQDMVSSLQYAPGSVAVLDAVVSGSTNSGSMSNQMFVNGLAGGLVTNAASLKNYTNNLIRIGGGNSTGQAYNYALNGDVGEVLIYNSSLSAADRTAVEQYLEHKWLGIGAAADVLPTNTDVVMSTAGAALDLNGVNQRVGSLAGVAGAQVMLGGGTLTVGGTATTTFAGAINGPGALVKSGGGTLVLSGTNGFTGPATVSGGTLIVNGSLTGGGGVSVAGGMLGGSGTVTGPVTLTGGSVLAPGNSQGLLTVASLSVGGGTSTTYAVDIMAGGGTSGANAGVSYDQTVVTGATGATLDAQLVLNDAAYAPTAQKGDAFFILNQTDAAATAVAGGSLAYAGAALADGATFTDGAGLTYAIYYDADANTGALSGGNDIALVATQAVPEPVGTGLIGLALAGLAGRRRRRR